LILIAPDESADSRRPESLSLGLRADRPVEHEERLKQLLARQAERNSSDIEEGREQRIVIM